MKPSVPFIGSSHRSSLGTRLVLLVAGSILPLATIAAVTTYGLSKAYDDAAASRLLRLSRAELSSMEGQIEEITTAEEVLASSSEIQGDDLEGFRRGAEGFLKTFMPSESLILSDLNDAELVDTSAAQPSGTRKIISAAVLESHHRVIETNKPQISTLFEAQMTHSFAISVSVPVLRDGKVVYVLDMPITPQHLSHVLEQLHFDPRWIVAMWDRNGTVIARNKDWEQYVGKEAGPSIRPFLSEEHDRVIATKTFEGEEGSTAISHSVLLGITLALGIPRESIVQPRQQALYLIIGVSVYVY